MVRAFLFPIFEFSSADFPQLMFAACLPAILLVGRDGFRGSAAA
jgi:hypothetical protein